MLSGSTSPKGKRRSMDLQSSSGSDSWHLEGDSILGPHGTVPYRWRADWGDFVGSAERFRVGNRRAKKPQVFLREQ